MREIKFRGKGIRTDKWVYGSLLEDYAGTCQIWEKDEINASHNYLVDPATVGQYTGLKDKSGKDIYEGDILDFEGRSNAVVWDNYNCGFNIVEYGIHTCKIIGNIYDNPELLNQ
jgi:hypothetical protein